jgi:hypothetical protein
MNFDGQIHAIDVTASERKEKKNFKQVRILRIRKRTERYDHGKHARRKLINLFVAVIISILWQKKMMKEINYCL